MIGYLSVLSVVAVALGFLFGMRKGILATLIMHPIAAAGWHVNYFIGPIKLNPLVIIGFAVPLVILGRALTQGPPIGRMPLAGIWITYLCYMIFAGTMHAVDEGAGWSLNLISRHVAGFVGFYMLQAFFTDRKDFKDLTIALVLSGLFPVLVIFYQIATGSGTLREMSEGGDLRLDNAMGLIRYSGFFHDIVSVRGYVFQCMAGILLYWAYFIRPNRDTVLKIFLIGFGVACLFVLYKMYSKAVLGTLIMWFGIWCVGNRRIGLGVLLALLVVGINALQADRIFSETSQLFQFELSEVSSDGAAVDSGKLLHGRVGMWEHLMQGFWKAPIVEQMFGYSTAFGVHNDFIQKLFYGGYVGLIIYTTLLVMIGSRIVSLYLKEKSPINLMAAMVFSGWMIDTIGVVPSLYPGYQWYAWGLIGLAIKGLDSVEKSETQAPKAVPRRPIWESD